MVKARLLNSEAELNDYFYITSVDYVPGSDVKVAFQVFNAQKNLRWVLPVAATVTAVMIDEDNDDISKTATLISSDDRALWTFTLSQAESQILASSNITITVDLNGNGSVIYKTVISNALSRSNLAGDC